MAYNFELASRLGSVGEYYFSRKLREIEEMRRNGADILSLGIGSPDMPPHPSVMERLALESAKPSVHGMASVSAWSYAPRVRSYHSSARKRV